MKEAIFPIEKVGEKYAIGEISQRFLPEFILKDPKKEELFLFLDKPDSLRLLKGSTTRGMRFCEEIGPCEVFTDCCIIHFVQDGIRMLIQIPTGKAEDQGKYYKELGGPSLTKLEVVPLEIAEE